MRRRKMGVWIIGALGSVSATVIAGSLALKKNLIPPVGMITGTEDFKPLCLVDVKDLVFGGCDIRETTLLAAVQDMLDEIPVRGGDMLALIRGEIKKIEPYITKGTVRNCGEAISGLASEGCRAGRSVREEIEEIRSTLNRFKDGLGLDEVVVVNLASTEPPVEYTRIHEDIESFEKYLDGNQDACIRASTLYAYAAIQEGFPYINFNPSNAALVPAMIDIAKKKGVPVMGNDGKTGETLIKSALAPMFSCRNLEVMSWEGFNILGNMDGKILHNSSNKLSKIRTKDHLLGKILGYTPHSKVSIDYVPSLGDQKTAWDFVHFRGFLGVPMSLQFVWQGYDSILAAPLVLDMIRLADHAKRRGQSGLMPQLALFFKSPIGVDEQRLYEQYQGLMRYLDREKAEAPNKTHKNKKRGD